MEARGGTENDEKVPFSSSLLASHEQPRPARSLPLHHPLCSIRQWNLCVSSRSARPFFPPAALYRAMRGFDGGISPSPPLFLREFSSRVGDEKRIDQRSVTADCPFLPPSRSSTLCH